MNILWTSAGTWMLHTAVGGGILLLVTCALMRWTRQPVRRQRLGDWGMTAALAVALCSGLAPSWLVIAWTRSEPAPQAETLMNEVPLGQYLITEDVQFNDGALGELALLETPPPDLRRGLAEEALQSASWIEQSGIIVILASAAIAGFFAIRLLLGYFALLRLLWRSEAAPPEISGLFNTMAAGTRWVRLLVSRRLLVPLSCGLVRPTVVLPASMCEPAAPRQLRWIFAHELTHLRRCDAWSALLFNLGQVFFFAVPWFWWLRRQVRLCQEYVADAAAAQQDEAHVDYAEFLLSLASAPAVPVGASAVSGNCSDLSRRVTMLLNDPAPVETRCPRLWTMLVAGGLASLAILVSGFGFRAEAAPDDQIVIIINTGGEQKKPEGKKATYKVEELVPYVGHIKIINEAGEVIYVLNGLNELPKTASKEVRLGITSGGDYVSIAPDGAVLSEGKPITVINKVAKVPGKGEVPLQDEKRFKVVNPAGEFKIWVGVNQDMLWLQGDELAELKNVLKQLEQLKKEGKLTKERIEQEITKALEQMKTRKVEIKVTVPTEKDGKDKKAGATEFLQSHLHLTPSAVYVSQKPRFGVNTEPISPAIAEHLKLPSNVGLLVTEVVADTPAAKVGVKVHDVLVKIGGAMVPGNSETFAQFVAGLKADTPLEVIVLRKGQTLTVGSVTLAGEAPKADKPKEAGDVKSMQKTVIKALDAQWKKLQEDAAKEKKAEESWAFRLKKFEDGQAKEMKREHKLLLDAKVEKAALNKDAATITVMVKDDILMIKQSEGTLTLTVSGVLKDGKVEVSAVEVRDDGQVRQYTSVAAVPEAHRGRVEELLKMLDRVTVKMDKE